VVDIHFTTTTDPVAALQNANYIITTLRVGGDESRIRDDCSAMRSSRIRLSSPPTRRVVII
jgi:6-phospho-beta-glucosidase